MRESFLIPLNRGLDSFLCKNPLKASRGALLVSAGGRQGIQKGRELALQGTELRRDAWGALPAHRHSTALSHPDMWGLV